jgi:hypothetical protein
MDAEETVGRQVTTEPAAELSVNSGSDRNLASVGRKRSSLLQQDIPHVLLKNCRVLSNSPFGRDSPMRKGLNTVH